MSLLPPEPSPALRDAMQTARTLHSAGHIALLAGGCVRDLLLGLAPKDYDVATDAPPPRVRQLFRRTQAVGAAFGVVLVHGDASTIEVATFRTDGDYTDGRRPESVQFTTADHDARRRDFTINGLFYDIVADKVVDYVDGQRDLSSRTLRAIGEPSHRFEEDHLRLLRAVRFAARYDLTLEPRTRDAIVTLATKLPRISPERIADELRKMFAAPTRAHAVELLWNLGLASVLMRSLATSGMPSLHRSSRTKATADTGFAVMLVTLVLDWLAGSQPLSEEMLSPKRCKAIEQMYRQTLRLSNDELAAVSGTLAIGPLLQGEPAVAMVRRFIARPHFAFARELLATLRRAGDFSDRIARVEAMLDHWTARGPTPPPWITGDDLIAAGILPSPRFKLSLDTAYDAQLESRVSTPAAALELALATMRG